MADVDKSGCSDEEHGELAQSLGRLWRAIISGMEHPPVGEVPFQPGQFRVLGALAEGPKRMSELAEITRTSSANITGIVDRLAERGIIERTRSESDRRVVDVALTEKGRAMMAEGMRVFCGRVAEVMAPLTPDEQRELARLLRKAVDEQ
jgi:DNA-binding MarR family transcriptional regulator